MIGILCSALGLGTYVPALLIREELAAAGRASRVFVFESFLQDKQREAIVKARRAYQRNAAFIRIGQKLIPKVHRDALPDPSSILEAMETAGISRFVVLNGFWLPVLARIAQVRSLATDLLHIDATSSPSWEAGRSAADGLDASHVWLGRLESGQVEHLIGVKCPQHPLAARQNAILAHGGGWSLGTYPDAARRIAMSGLPVHIVLTARSRNSQPWAARVFRLDPRWEAWSVSDQPPSFPPLLGLSAGIDGVTGHAYHDLLGLLCRVKGVISKPGGATMVDCIASGTPLIYVEPQGDHEASNALLWTSLGLAVSFEEWARAAFSEDVLHEVHLNLCRVREETPSYVHTRILDSS